MTVASMVDNLVLMKVGQRVALTVYNLVEYLVVELAQLMVDSMAD